MEALILTGVLFSILVLWWAVLIWTLDLLNRALEALRAESEPRTSGAEPVNRREPSN